MPLFLQHGLAECLTHYIAQVGDTVNAGEFLAKLASHSPDHQEQIMTIAQKLKQEGHHEGRQEGRRETLHEVARRMLIKDVDRVLIKSSTGLSDKELDKIAQ